MRELDIAENGPSNVWADLQGVFRDRDCLHLPSFWLDQSVIREWGLSSEDVEHKSYALEAEHVISVRRYFDFELRGFLFPIDNGSLLVCGIFVELYPKFET